MNDYWQNVARELIDQANAGDLFKQDDEYGLRMARWIGRAQSTLEEALRVSGNASA